MLMVRGEKSLHLETRGPIIFILLLVVVGLWVDPFLGYVPFDYGRWLGPWYQHILNEGRVAAFSHPFGNYTPPYLYLLSAATFLDGLVHPLIAIKLLSAAGAVWLAYAVFSLLRAVDAPRPAEGAIWTLVLPTIFFNVPMLAQADAFWIAPCVLAVAAAVRGNSLGMVLWASLAFAVKAQAVFFAPFVMAFLVNRKSPIWYWALPLLVYAVAMLPAWLVGWPATDLATVYLRQVAWVPASGVPFVSNAANWWFVFKLIAQEVAINSFWVGYMLAAGSAVLFVGYFARRQLTLRTLIAASILSAAMMPWLLPGMHERFFALAEILAFCFAWKFRDRASIAIAALMQLGVALSMLGWLMGRTELTIAALFCVTATLVWLVRESAKAAPALPA